MSTRKKQTIQAHCLVRNEENWAWYAINSVIDYVDSILVYDTGSTDKTVEIIKTIKSPKIKIEKKGKVTPERFTKMRQEMLDRCDTDWFLILDGDDVWPEPTIRELRTKVEKSDRKKKAVVAGYFNCVGDVFHYSKEVASLRSTLDPEGPPGGLTIRAIKRNIPGLHCEGIHGNQGYFTKKGEDPSKWGRNSHIFLKGKYLHMSYLPRSSSVEKDRQVPFRGQKRRYVKGVPFPEDFVYPEVFYKKRQSIVSSPWRRLSTSDQIKGLYYRSQNLVERLKKGEEIRGLAH